MLDALRHKINNHTAHIGVIGLGYVGLPVACMMAKSGFHTIGIDVDQARVDTIARGENPIKGIEPDIAELIADVVSADLLHCSTDYDALKSCDVILISVQTPIEDDTHRPHYQHMKNALNALGATLKKGALVIIESTLAPGTMSQVIIPTLEAATMGKVDTDFYVGHCPERVTPGRLLKNLTDMNRSVGGSSPQIAEIMSALYANYVTGDLDETDLLTAELVKTAENAYRDVQIAFANELAQICQAIGGDVWRVRELVNKSPGRNVLMPGAGVGGHCIPKDPWLLIANIDTIEPTLIPTARSVNRNMPYVVKNLLTQALAESDVSLNDAVVAVMGYAYMENSDDTRDTPTQAFIDLINDDVAEVRVHDPFVEPYIGSLETSTKDADAVILMVKHDDYYQEDWLKRADSMRTKIIIDTRHILPDDFQLSDGIVTVLGQGD